MVVWLLLNSICHAVKLDSLSFDEKIRVMVKNVPPIDGIVERGLMVPTSQGLIPRVRLNAWARELVPKTEIEARKIVALSSSNQGEIRYIAIRALALKNNIGKLPPGISYLDALRPVESRQYLQILRLVLPKGTN